MAFHSAHTKQALRGNVDYTAVFSQQIITTNFSKIFFTVFDSKIDVLSPVLKIFSFVNIKG